jgi:hypothetical protein
MADRFFSGVLALSLAFLVWLYARGREQEAIDNVPIPVQLTLAPGQEDHYDLEVTGPSQVTASFSGPPSRIRELRGMLQRGEVKVGLIVSVPDDRADESRFADTVRVEPADVPVPAGVSVAVLEGRNRIPVTLRRITECRLPVHFEHTADDGIGPVAVEPADVLVRGPQEILEHVHAVPTQPYSLPPRPDTGPPGQERVTTVRVPLVRDLEGRAVRTTPDVVTVRLTMRPRQRVYDLADVPVQFLCPANFRLRPTFEDDRAGKVSLHVAGPASQTAPAVAAYVDLTRKETADPGLYDEPIRVTLPPEFHLAGPAPRSVSFRLVPVDTSLKGAANH